MTSSKKIYYSAYASILLLYLKLFFSDSVITIIDTDINLPLLLLLFLFVSISFKLIIKGEDILGNNSPSKLFWIFVFASTISSFFLSPKIASDVAAVNFQLFLVYLLFIAFKSYKIDGNRLNKIINALNYFALVNVFLVYFVFFFGNSWFLDDVNNGINAPRAFGLMGDQLPWFLSFFALHSLFKGNKYHFVFLSSGIVMGASLGATIVLILSILLFAVKIKKITMSFFIKIGTAILLLTVVLLSSPSTINKIGLVKRFNDGDFSGTESRTAGHRIIAYTNAINEIRKKPLWGHQNYSLSMFDKYNNQLTSAEKGNLSFLTSPNNQILAILADYGLIGLGIFVFFILRLLKIIRVKSIRLPTNFYVFKQSSYIWMIVFIIFNQSATWFLPGSYLWVLICIIVGVSYKIDKLYGIK